MRWEGRTDLALLLLRLGAGLMLAFGHGLGKAMRILDGRFQFADPIGLGPAVSLVLVAFAELVCGVLVAVGFKTRWTAVPPAIAMLVAALVHHIPDPWGKKEFPLLYATVFIALILLGGGRYSLDRLLKKRG